MNTVSLAEWDWTSPELPVHEWWFFGVVLIVLIIVIWTVVLLTASSSDDIDPAEIDRQMLTAVNDLQSQGELTPEEYRSIKSRLVQRLADQSSGADFDGSPHNDQPTQQTEGQPTTNVDKCDETKKVQPNGAEDPHHSQNELRNNDETC